MKNTQDKTNEKKRCVKAYDKRNRKQTKAWLNHGGQNDEE